ncbi:MAG TPA: hypothetical protein PLB55_04040, partial [Prosthecobacter sp.]|nr:hypothetical protein [Prosthecobacter sp.]
MAERGADRHAVLGSGTIRDVINRSLHLVIRVRRVQQRLINIPNDLHARVVAVDEELLRLR